MEDLINVVNRLQDTLTSVNLHMVLDLPQIAVVGSQSVGKTSVLESIVGKDFLPRGTGIVTRRPLVLQLRNTKDRTGTGGRECGEFNHIPAQSFEDFSQVRREIERETDRVCGTNKGVVNQPIVLKVSSPHVIDLTLVDLPGLTKVPVGDQPTDIGRRIRELVLQYITRENCLILAVTAANSDLANSDSLALAREVDPEGRRTIGVLTKLDLMDSGTDAVDVLSGRVYPLKQGHVGVVCRSQKDVQADRTIRDALAQEEAFFRGHPAYRGFAHRCGVPYLAKSLNQILMFHIREVLPELKNRIVRMIHERETELAGYGDPIVEQKTNQGAVLLHLFSKFARNFADSIDGKLSGVGRAPSDQLAGAARIHYIFQDIFARAVWDFDTFSGISDMEIRMAIRNATGPKASLFVPEVAFELLAKKQIAKLEEPALQCVDLIFEELQRIAMQCELPEMKRFMNLRERIFEVVRGVLKRCLQPTNQMIINLIHIELAYINTNHPDFIGGSRALSAMHGHGYGVGEHGLAGAWPPPAPQPPRAPGRGPAAGSGVAGSGGRGTTIGTSKGAFGFWGNREASAGEAQSVGGLGAPGLGGVGSDPNSQAIRLPQVPHVVAPSDAPTDRERMEIDIIKSLLTSYFNVCKKKVTDAVPKSIMYFMVNTARDVLQRECVSQLYRPEIFELLLQEADDVRERRTKCKESLRGLRRALDMLGQIRDHQLGAGSTTQGL